jgi:hypothetical protein
VTALPAEGPVALVPPALGFAAIVTISCTLMKEKQREAAFKFEIMPDHMDTQRRRWNCRIDHEDRGSGVGCSVGRVCVFMR